MGIIVVRPPPPPRGEVRILRRTATRAHFVDINKGPGQFYLSSDTSSVQSQYLFPGWRQRTAVKVVENALQYIKIYAAGVRAKTAKRYLKMSRNKSFNFRARFGAIYSASKTKKYLLKNSTLGNRLLFSELANTEFTCTENSTWWLHLLDSNLFLKFQNNFTAEFWATFSYGLLLQRFFWNSSGIFIMSIKADTRNFSNKYQQFFLLDTIFFEQKGPFKP